jgi:hypothetical protein
MEQTKTEEVKTTGKVATLKRRMATALTRTRFGSNEVTAPCELGHPPGRPLGRLQRLSRARTKTDPMMHRATKERV